MELDLASFRNLHWLDDDADSEVDQVRQFPETNTHTRQQQHQTQQQHKQRRDDEPPHPLHTKKGKQKAKTASPSKSRDALHHEWDELTLDPDDALKLKVVIQAYVFDSSCNAPPLTPHSIQTQLNRSSNSIPLLLHNRTAPALLHFRKGARQVPLRDMIPNDLALINPPIPSQTETNQPPLKIVWPTPERIERLKTVAIVQLPRDLEAEADQADGIEQDSFASLSDALEAALATTDSQQRNSSAHADESREEEDFVRLRNVIVSAYNGGPSQGGMLIPFSFLQLLVSTQFLVSSIHRQLRRLLRNPSQPSSFPDTDASGRALPSIRHKDFRIVSQPAPLKTEEETLVNGDQTSPAPPGAPALTPITLSRADSALTTLWTQSWFSEVLRGSTLALALLNELAERKRAKPETVDRVAATLANIKSETAAGDEDALLPTRKRARLDYDGRTLRLHQHPPRVALHMRLGAHGDLFTNAVDMPRKFWERQRAVAVGQFAAEGAEEEEQTDDDGGDDDEESGAGTRLRRRPPGRKGQYAGSGTGPGPNASSLAASAAAVEAAIQAVKRGRPKGSGKGMGKGWRKGRTKAMEESEEVNRVEDRRKDRWAMGDIEFGEWNYGLHATS